jgi:hypothetical protein
MGIAQWQPSTCKSLSLNLVKGVEGQVQTEHVH